MRLSHFNKTLFTAAIFAAAHFTVSAQEALSQYYSVPSLFNPAAAGASGKLDLRAAARFNCTGTDPEGRLLSFAAAAPLSIAGNIFGAGLTVSHDTSSPIRTITGGIQGSFSKPAFGGRIWGGIGIAYIKEKYNYPVSTDPDAGTSTLPDDSGLRQSTTRTELNGSAVDIGAGIFFTHRWLWGGVSVLHANAPEINFGTLPSTVPPDSDNESEPSDNTADGNKAEDITRRIPRTLFIMAGSDIRLSRSLELLPSAMLRTAGGSTRVEITGRVRFRGLVTVGASWRNAELLSATASIGHKGFFVGYSYGYPLQKSMRSLVHASHEIMAGYSLSIGSPKKPATRHKSIRIM